MTQKLPGTRSKIWHAPHGTPYMIENSWVGAEAAEADGFKWLDWDLQITLDGIVVVAHWDLVTKDWFEIPAWFEKKYGRNPRISLTKWIDLSKLRTKPIKFRGKTHVLQYRTIGQMLVYLKDHTKQLGASLEFKGSNEFEKVDTMMNIKASVQRSGIGAARVQYMTLIYLGEPLKRLQAMKKAGLNPRILLTQGAHPRPYSVPEAWEPNITYIRGRWVPTSGVSPREVRD